MPMPQHKRISLCFAREGELKFDLFFIYICSWATKEQVDLAWKVATIALLEGWTLKNRKEYEESDTVASLCHSLRFGVKFWREEFSYFEFFPADVAKFDHSLLESAVKQAVASGSSLSA